MNLSLSLLVFVALTAATAMSGAVFRPGDWYEALNKPPWQPPSWLFAPVWMVLYGMIAVSGWLVWRSAGLEGGTIALGVYLAQLVLNFCWSWIFFGHRRPDLALVEIIALWLSVLATIVLFHPISTGAAWLLVPYLLWVSFAMVLNFSIWRRNPRDLAATG
ncbi:MAG: tryptophan-rich sensory protein [Gammaproteobacteria bacterium]|nr:tryptophan-rich sensory protein [Gammaproteobacteria bacterium]